jgi:hypothetical protein
MVPKLCWFDFMLTTIPPPVFLILTQKAEEKRDERETKVEKISI